MVKRPTGKPLVSTNAGVVVDSGPFIALFNGADSWHARVLAWLKAHPRSRLHSTWPVMTEVCALVARRLNNDAALDFLRWVQRGGVSVDHAVPATMGEVIAISEQFSDLTFDLADASVAELAARLGIDAVLTIDRSFDAYRNAAGKPLTNLLRAKHSAVTPQRARSRRAEPASYPRARP